VTGEDEWGNACEEHKTRARTLTLRKAVMIPSVGTALLILRMKLTSVCTNPRVCGSPNMCVICTRSSGRANCQMQVSRRPHCLLVQTYHVCFVDETSRQTTTRPRSNLPNNAITRMHPVNSQKGNARSAVVTLCCPDQACGEIALVG